jgi:hypothetical protein
MNRGGGCVWGWGYRHPVFDPSAPAPPLIVLSRFRVPTEDLPGFELNARQAVGVLSACEGFVRASVGQATDDPELQVIVTEWTGVGAYRRALSRYEVKASAIPFLSHAIDEPSAFEVVHGRTPLAEAGGTSGLALDAASIPRVS